MIKIKVKLEDIEIECETDFKEKENVLSHLSYSEFLLTLQETIEKTVTEVLRIAK